MEGSFPNELKRVFKGLTNNANPWGIGASNRLDWAKGETIPLISDHPDAEYLLFLGCAAAFDDRAQHISRKLIQFLNKHQISYALLGENETCCGETARRLGEEGIGQTLMKMNIEMFNELGIKKIITPCPHCFNTFKNEYPLLGGKYQIMHHSELILDLLKSGKIKLDKEMAEKITIHDSCYLGRLNQMYDTPREIVKQIPKAQLVEHARSKDHGFCCGAGGGMFWLEEKEPRINITRCKQLAELNPSTIATFCPYCLKMLDDGIKDLKLEHIKVLDIIEIIS
jgi:Fe-S oxidoreductase